MTGTLVVKRLGIYFVAFALTASVLVSCKKQEAKQGAVDVHADTNGTATVPSSDAVVVKNEYVRKMEAKLDVLDERVKALKDNAKRAGGSAKNGVDDRISSLDKELESAKSELSEITKSDHKTEELRSRLDERINDIDKALSDTVASIR